MSKCQPQHIEGEDDKWREWARVFRSWSGGILGGDAQVYEHLEGHRSEPATINDKAHTTLRFGTGFLRNISTELYHVLIMLIVLTSTTDGAQGGTAGVAGSVLLFFLTL